MIRPVIDYVNVVWTTCDCLNRVLKLQKRAARIILDADMTRYANFNITRPVIKRKTEGGRKFTVTACQAWNSLPLSMRKIASLNSFRNSLGKKFFEEQQLLNPFIL